MTYLPFRDPNELYCDPMVGREDVSASHTPNGSGTPTGTGTPNGTDSENGTPNGDASAIWAASSRMYSSLSGRRTEDIPLEEKGPGLLIVTLHQGAYRVIFCQAVTYNCLL